MTPTQAQPVVSVCVSTRGRAAMLEDLFSALAAQDIDEPFEVSITDNCSPDNTSEVLAKLSASMPFTVKVHRNTIPGGPAAGRNIAAAHAAAPLLAFTDDDCRPESGWLRAGVKAMSGGRAVVVGDVGPPPKSPLGHPLGRVVRSSHWRFFTTSNVFYRADDFAASGGFDTDFTGVGGEDADLGLRICKAGAEPRYEPTARVIHPVREPDLKTTLREAYRWYGIPRLVKKHPEQRQVFLHHRLFWRRNHQWMLLALVSLVATSRSRWAVVGVIPWFWTRVWRARNRRDRVRNIAFAPVMATVDVLEMGALVRGSVQDRTFTL